MSNTIHPSAIVSPKAVIGEGVVIGPYSVVEDNATIGDGSTIESFVHIKSFVRLGKNNHVHSYVCIGGEPQHLAYKNEETWVEIGDSNTIRECATINRGTVQGHGKTSIGSHCLIMAYAHVAHDCVLGDHVIMANAVNLAGHVEIGNHAVVSGMAAVQQFLRIGEYAFLGGSSGYNLDIPPYMLAHGVRGRLMGPNLIGLRRHGFDTEACRALKKAYKIIFRSGLPREKAIEQALAEFPNVPAVANVVEFMRGSKCGVAPDYHKNGD
ncbi:acyl-ACP--UDP-N-acetylglucosamine O-acyltransferase [Paucidesulfovibrio longus]|uniref:acyl-ACP--UDP-N-acetylglucosamine O-acyltransferase n=1 Tax=Paucidesulfovibrio longus TaxID=889 RepID=UPI0003B584F5|nr:acyl-ACP--UDP-N-acetylglucosamine O-acyltransferase [Paucidesulfovibrio longus]